MKRFIYILFFSLFLNANAEILDFSQKGDINSNKILKDFIMQNGVINNDTEAISYFYDIDNDGKKEILGIVKSPYFYSLAGYKLFALKENNSKWEIIKTDVYFDNSQKFEIKNKEIIYHKSVFYKNQKHKAHIKKNKITTPDSFLDCFKNKKAHNIEEITKFSEEHIQNNFELENFHAQQQRNVNINYKNLNEKTKHYLDLK